jgi:hypothetical protein
MKNRPFIVIAAFIICAMAPFRAHAFGATFDGGQLQGMDTMCTCSGGETIKIKSYVDNSQHVYLYELGATKLYANYNIMSMNGYFLATLTPFAECLVYKGEECDSSSGQSPEGTFSQIGTSFNDSRNSLMALLKQFPIISDVTDAFSKLLARSSTESLSL